MDRVGRHGSRIPKADASAQARSRPRPSSPKIQGDVTAAVTLRRYKRKCGRKASLELPPSRPADRVDAPPAPGLPPRGGGRSPRASDPALRSDRPVAWARARQRRPGRRGRRSDRRDLEPGQDLLPRARGHEARPRRRTTSRSPTPLSVTAAGGRPCSSASPTAPAASRSSRSGSPTARRSGCETTVVDHAQRHDVERLVVADIAHVVWAVNLGCLGLHLWPYRADDPEHADELRIDLDPQPGTTFDDDPGGGRLRPRPARRAGDRRRTRRRPGTGASTSTSGSSPGGTASRSGPAAVALARELERRHPDLITAELVEGGARRAGLRRLQPERSAQDRLRRVVRPAAGRGPGLDAADLGRGRHRRPGGADDPHGARPASRERGDPWAAIGRRAAVARAAAGHGGSGPGRRAARRPVAARVPQAARRAAAGRAEPGQEGLSRWSRPRRCAASPTCSSATAPRPTRCGRSATPPRRSPSVPADELAAMAPARLQRSPASARPAPR